MGNIECNDANQNDLLGGRDGRPTENQIHNCSTPRSSNTNFDSQRILSARPLSVQSPND